ncbi:MAG: phosphoribosyltransferase family protein [Patescibacteria group bacterium]
MKKLFIYILELLLPQSKILKEIDALTPENLKKLTLKNSGNLPKDTTAIFDYKNLLIKQMIWELKYRGNKKVAHLFAECLYDELAEELSEREIFEAFGKPILIPIPLSKTRRAERGFNQCELVTDLVYSKDGGNFFQYEKNLLVKNKDTVSQTKKNRSERLENLSGCFEVSDPEKISGKNIILFDDVTTTGATFDEAARALRRAGARKILSIALAH